MKHRKQTVRQIVALLENCTDDNLLDLIYKLLIESGVTT